MRLAQWPVGREMEDMFDRFFRGLQDTPGLGYGSTYSIPMDVFHADGRLVIRIDLPGVSPDDVELTVQENNLLVNGKREFPYKAEEVRFVRRGSFYGDFTQKVTLGRGLDTEKIEARFDNGVLEVTIPYTEEVQPRKISISAGNGSKALSN